MLQAQFEGSSTAGQLTTYFALLEMVVFQSHTHPQALPECPIPSDELNLFLPSHMQSDPSSQCWTGNANTIKVPRRSQAGQRLTMR